MVLISTHIITSREVLKGTGKQQKKKLLEGLARLFKGEKNMTIMEGIVAIVGIIAFTFIAICIIYKDKLK